MNETVEQPRQLWPMRRVTGSDRDTRCGYSVSVSSVEYCRPLSVESDSPLGSVPGIYVRLLIAVWSYFSAGYVMPNRE